MAAAESLYDLLGRVDNLDDPIPPLDQPAVALTLTSVFLVLALVCASLRLYVRFRVTKCPWWDDFFVALSMITGAVLGASVMIGFHFHNGEHFLNFAHDLDAVYNFARSSYVQNALFPTATSFVKIAILLQFLRLFEDKPRYQQATIAVLVLASLWGAAFSFISWVPAFPVSAFWDLNNTDAVRYGIASLDPDAFTATYITLTSTNMLVDLLILLIPLPHYFSSTITKKARMSLLGLFFIGTVISLVSLGRLIEVVNTRAGTYPTLDPSFYGTPPIVLSSIEVSISIVAASLPVFWPMLRFDLGRGIHVTTEVTVSTQEPGIGGGGAGLGDGGRATSRTPNSARHPWDAKVGGRWEARVVPMVPLGKKKSTRRFFEKDEEALIGVSKRVEEGQV